MLSRCKIARQLFKLIFLSFNVECSLLHSVLSAASPVSGLVTKAHSVGLDGELRVQMLLAVVEFVESLVLCLLLCLCNLLLDLEAPCYLGLNLRIGTAVRTSDGGLHVSALFDDVKGLLNDGRFLEVSNVGCRHALLMPQVIKHSLILLFSQLFRLDLAYSTVVDTSNVGLDMTRTELAIALVRDMALVEVYTNYEKHNNIVTSLDRLVSVSWVCVVDGADDDFIGLAVCALLGIKD